MVKQANINSEDEDEVETKPNKKQNSQNAKRKQPPKKSSDRSYLMRQLYDQNYEGFWVKENEYF